MGLSRRRHIVLDTIGKLHAHGHGLFGYCRRCDRHFDVPPPPHPAWQEEFGATPTLVGPTRAQLLNSRTSRTTIARLAMPSLSVR
jgi:hypothetical protein